MWRVGIPVLALGLAPVTAESGAWLRAEGESFLSFSTERAARPETGFTGFTSLYGEHGLTPGLTLGAKIGQAADGRSEAHGFLRLPLGDAQGGNRFAAELGLGLRSAPSQDTEIVLKPGLSWGRGFGAAIGSGWLSVDAVISHGLSSTQSWANIDATFGLDLNETSSLVLQARTYADESGAIVTFAPSLVRDLGPRLRLQLGALLPAGRDEATGVLASAWLDF